ncbi:MAG: hypothetical protein R3F60_32945 [bacterium]
MNGPLLAAIVVGLACLGCGDEGGDDGGGAAPDETLTASELDALATCAVPFEAIVRSGANAGLEVRGLFVFDRTASLDGAALGLDTGGQAIVAGSVTGDQISLQITLPEGGTIAGTGTLDVSLDEGCGGSMAGPFTGPGPDDAGDWIVYPEHHETVRGADFTTWYLLPYSLGRTQILRQTIRTAVDAAGVHTRVVDDPVVLGIGALAGPRGIAALTPGGLALTREGDAYIVWVTDAESGELRGYRDEGETLSLVATLDPAAMAARAEALGFAGLAPFRARGLRRIGDYFRDYSYLMVTDEENHVIWTVDRRDASLDVADQVALGLGGPGQAGARLGVGGAARLTSPASAAVSYANSQRYPVVRVTGLGCQLALVRQTRTAGVPALSAGRLIDLATCAFSTP